MEGMVLFVFEVLPFWFSNVFIINLNIFLLLLEGGLLPFLFLSNLSRH